MSLANISLVGNLVKAPEQIQFSSGRIKTTLIVAVNGLSKAAKSGENVKDKVENNGGAAQTADFYRVETWGKLAELASRYLNKGNQVTVSGRLVMDHWTDKYGVNRITPVVEANQLSLPQKPKSSEFDDKVKEAS